MRTVYNTADVDKEVLAIAEEVEEWFPKRIDWEEFWDRLENYGVFVGDMGSPAALKIQRHIREMRQ